MLKNNKWINWSNGITATMFMLVLALMINPEIKVFFIKGLMNLGFFQPSVSENDLNQTSKISFDNSVAFKSENGETVSLNDLKGKVVFINFWATWCPPCIAEMPAINKMSQHFKDDNNLVFLMVDADANLQKSVKFMERKKMQLKVFTAATAIPENMFGGALPTTLVLNKKGQIVFKHEGSAAYNNQKFIDFVANLLKE